MLCQTCQNIFRGPFPYEPESESESVLPTNVTHHASIGDLHRSALEDCYICRVLWNRYILYRQTNTKSL
jgi:hypothetical protein